MSSTHQRTVDIRAGACHNGTDCTVTPDVSALGPGGVHDTADIAVVAAKNQVAKRIHEKKFGHGSVDKYYRIQQQEAGVQRDLRRQHRKGLLSTCDPQSRVGRDAAQAEGENI